MKTTATCPKCESKRVMHLPRVADATDYYGAGTGDLSVRSAGSAPVPRRVLLRRTTAQGLFGTSESYEPTGDVEAYVCADCGYFEEYLRAPAKIDWAHIVGATPHTVKQGGGPFR